MDDITGRDNFIVSLALFVAARALRSQQYPPEADIADMEKMLAKRYPSQRDMLEALNDIKIATRLGFVPDMPDARLPDDVTGQYDPDKVKAWIAQHKGDNDVVALFDTPIGTP